MSVEYTWIHSSSTKANSSLDYGTMPFYFLDYSCTVNDSAFSLMCHQSFFSDWS